MCQHYDTRCTISSECCNTFYPCRQCHDSVELHQMDRYQINRVCCQECTTIQDPSNQCKSCHTIFSRHFCPRCNLWSGEEAFHCESCNICYKKITFHCDTCNLCFETKEHTCKKNADNIGQECSVCFEALFYTVRPPVVLRCGHCIHADCLKQMMENNRYQCPLCKKTMSEVDWQYIHNLVRRFPTEEKKEITVLCNDCVETSNTIHHPFGNECMRCGSFNTVLAS